MLCHPLPIRRAKKIPFFPYIFCIKFARKRYFLFLTEYYSAIGIFKKGGLPGVAACTSNLATFKVENGVSLIIIWYISPPTDR